MRVETELLKTATAEDRAHAVGRAAEILNSGGILAVPTETVYGLAARADRKEAMERLRRIKGRDAHKPFTYVFPDAELAFGAAASVSAGARRLAARYWPGPLTLILDAATPAPDLPGESIGVRVPGDPICLEILRATGAGVALPSANPAGDPPALSADGVLAYFRTQIDAVVDGGPSAIGTPSTVVDGRGGALRVVRDGFLTPEEIRRAAATAILFVCSGNTCRSPMAAALLRSELAKILKVTVAELPAAGFSVRSAGLYAGPGQPSSPGARAAMDRRSIDLDPHRSRPLDLPLLRGQDQVFAMTRSIEERLLEVAPDPSTVRLVRPDGQDVTDPFGGSDEVYERCALELEDLVRTIAQSLTSR